MQLVANLLAEWERGCAGVWIPGCASGEEAYTLAVLTQDSERPLDILGTDINQQALELARAGRYSRSALRTVPKELHRYFPSAAGSVNVAGSVQQRVRFAAHNLMTAAPPPPAGNGWEVIVCRNVLMYFSPGQRAVAMQHLSAALAPGGFLFLGASEYHRLGDSFERIERDGQCVLRKETQRASAAVSPPDAAEEPQDRFAIRGPSPEPALRLRGPLADAAAQVQRGQVSEAIAALQAMLQREPLYTEALLLIGVAYYLSDQDSAAVATLQQALFLRPALWPAAFYLALSLDRLGQSEAARTAFRWVERESSRPLPDEQPLLELLGVASWKAELLQTARTRARRDDEGRTKSVP